MLGGTAWLGRLVAEGARDAGHDVTVLARGEAGAPPDGVRSVVADRDEVGCYAEVALSDWDAVVELTSTPSRTLGALSALGPRTARWVVISTTSVYSDTATTGADETAAVVDPGTTDDAPYAAAKVAIEQLVREGAGESRTLVLRAGLLGGAGDLSGRSGWWPWRASRPGPLVVPDEPDLPTQLLDARDLAAFVVAQLVGGAVGVLDVVGPVVPFGDLVATALEVAGRSSDDVLVVPPALLEALGVQYWAGPSSLPLWLPRPGHDGSVSRSGAAARASGLTTRPLARTLRDVLAWEATRDDQPRRAGLTPDDERRVLDGTA
ncbi:SDR family oxidoreductase [Frigoribacterium salinisoli]